MIDAGFVAQNPKYTSNKSSQVLCTEYDVRDWDPEVFVRAEARGMTRLSYLVNLFDTISTIYQDTGAGSPVRILKERFSAHGFPTRCIVFGRFLGSRWAGTN